MNITSPNYLFHAPQPRSVSLPPYKCCDFQSVIARSDITGLLQIVTPDIFCNLESCLVKVMWIPVHLPNRCFGVDGPRSRASQRLLGPSSLPPGHRDRPSTKKNGQIYVTLLCP